MEKARLCPLSTMEKARLCLLSTMEKALLCPRHTMDKSLLRLHATFLRGLRPDYPDRMREHTTRRFRQMMAVHGWLYCTSLPCTFLPSRLLASLSAQQSGPICAPLGPARCKRDGVPPVSPSALLPPAEHPWPSQLLPSASPGCPCAPPSSVCRLFCPHAKLPSGNETREAREERVEGCVCVTQLSV